LQKHYTQEEVAKLLFNQILQRTPTMNQEIGSTIKFHRKRLGLTLTELQNRTGINNGNLSKIERGQQSLTNDTMKSIAKALGMSLGDLFSAGQAQTTNLRHNGAAKPFSKQRFAGDFDSVDQIPEGEFVALPSISTSIDPVRGGVKVGKDNSLPHLFQGEAFKDLAITALDALACHVVADDTMEPRLFAGDVAVVDMGSQGIPATGGVFCVIMDDENVEFRRLMPYPGKGLRIICDNPKYPEAVLDARQAAAVQIVGRVKMVRSTSGL
jgi:transcriptional regulator with XRE-family HTH domain